jgi:hypothetical protein
MNKGVVESTGEETAGPFCKGLFMFFVFENRFDSA